MRLVQDVAAVNPDPLATRTWGIPEEPSMSVTVSPGQLLVEHLRVGRETPVEVIGGHDDGVYAACECGSGRKVKFCCRGLPKAS